VFSNLVRNIVQGIAGSQQYSMALLFLPPFIRNKKQHFLWVILMELFIVVRFKEKENNFGPIPQIVRKTSPILRLQRYRMFLIVSETYFHVHI